MGKILSAFSSKRMLVTLLLGFSSGLPLALSGSALQYWMKKEGVDLTLIGIFALVGLPYTWKPLWAPLMDRYTPPIFGKRRGWIILSQIGLIVSIFAMSCLSPTQTPFAVALTAFIMAFFSASQDIVVDAYRIETLKPEEYGAGAGVYTMGYRIAMLISGGLTFSLADSLPWSAIYILMSATMLIGLVTTLFAPEPVLEERAPTSLLNAVVQPLAEFFKRPGVIEIILFIFLYKMDAVFASALLSAFFIDLKFTGTEIFLVFKTYGMVATILGTLTGGAIMVRLGIERSLWIFGFAQGLAGLSFMALAMIGKNFPMMITAITAENFCSGMGTAAYAAFLMSLVNKKFTATQYALLSSLMAMTRIIGTTPSGWVAKHAGWPAYFFISILFAVPALLLLTRYKVWMQKTQAVTN